MRSCLAVLESLGGYYRLFVNLESLMLEYCQDGNKPWLVEWQVFVYLCLEVHLTVSTPASVVMDRPAIRRGLKVVMREEKLKSRARFPFGKEAQLAFALHVVLCSGGLVSFY